MLKDFHFKIDYNFFAFRWEFQLRERMVEQQQKQFDMYMYSELDEPAPKFKLAVFASTANVFHHDKCSNLNRKEIGNIELFSGEKLNKYW